MPYNGQISKKINFVSFITEELDTMFVVMMQMAV